MIVVGSVIFSPYIKHVLEGWNQRHHPNMLFLFYEDLKKDLRGETLKVAKYLNVTMTEDQLTKLLDHLRIERFKENNSVNMEDVRKSQVGMFPDKTRLKRQVRIFNAVLRHRHFQLIENV